MVTNMDKSLCTGCGVCQVICPRGSITMKKDKYGFLYPSIDQNTCINCNKCDNFCHAQNIKTQSVEVPDSYIGYNKNADQRLKSSSGGIFVLLAEEILKLNGAVYGAAFDHNGEVSHIRVEEKSNLYKLQGSKYVQSTVDKEIYLSVKSELENKKYILYSGTPCQIGALKQFLNRNYETLLTVSFICHGVPSPALWKQYVDEQSEKYNSSISGMSHRNKKYGWTRYSMSMRFENGSEYCVPNDKDPYMQLFLKNTCLRDSCYSCQYKGKEKLSCIDILLADKWGNVSGTVPDIHDDKGISTIFVQSTLGRILWDRIKENLYYDKTVFQEVVDSNAAYNQSCVASKYKNNVLSEIGAVSVKEIYSRYAKTPLSKRIKRKMVFFIHRGAQKLGIVKLVKKVKKGQTKQ